MAVNLEKMVKTTKVSAIDSTGKQSPRLIKLVAGLCIGQIVMGIVTTTIVGVIVDRHVSSSFLFKPSDKWWKTIHLLY